MTRVRVRTSRVVRSLRGATAALLLVPVAGCDYIRLLRPSVLGQLNPRVVRLVNYLPEIDEPNKAIVGQLAAHGGLTHATIDRAGVMTATVRALPGKYLWGPAVVVMPRAGELVLDFQNNDAHAHAALVASTPEREHLELPPHTAGRTRVRLTQPGLYTFACPVSNHAGRGMIGFIIVRGETPAEARLDRPRQRRP